MATDPTLHERIDKLLRAGQLVTVVADMQATLRAPGAVSLLERPLCRIRTLMLRRTDAGLRAVVELELAWRRAGSAESDATLERTLRAIVIELREVAGALPELDDISIYHGLEPTDRKDIPEGIYDIAILNVQDA